MLSQRRHEQIPVSGGGLARVCNPDQLDVVVTWAGSDGVTLAALAEAGVEVGEG